MKKKLPLLLFIIAIVGLVFWFGFLLTGVNLQILNPQGMIAEGQRDLIVGAMGIMLSIAIPVVLIAFFISWKYRDSSKKSAHMPEWTGSRLIKSGYWIFFGTLASIFFIIVWISSHELDPYRPITSSEEPITIQVVALQWKWLFIYPEERIATVNFLQIPVNTPINFRLITADGPMNSFWIPQLGGQIYSMTAMETKLHLIAENIGDFQGGAAEINGKGFSGMRFIVRSGSKEEYETWLDEVYSSPNYLDNEAYEALLKPSENNPVTYYHSVEPGLYNMIMNKFMKPVPSRETSKTEAEEMH